MYVLCPVCIPLSVAIYFISRSWLIVDGAAMNIGVHNLFEVEFSSDMCPGVGCCIKW